MASRNSYSGENDNLALEASVVILIKKIFGKSLGVLRAAEEMRCVILIWVRASRLVPRASLVLLTTIVLA